MFCHNCGKQIPDGAAFCTYCGAPQGAASPAAPPTQTQARPAAPAPGQPPKAAPAPARQAPQKPQKPQKKWAMFLLPVAVFFVAGLLGRFVFAPSMQPEKSGGSVPFEPAPTVAPLPTVDIDAPDGAADTDGTDAEGSDTNPAYTDVFMGSRVFHLSFLFGLDVESFAMKDEDGDILVHDFGHNGDQVLTFVETWYYPGITADQQDYIQTLTDAAAQEAAAYSSIACANVTYSYNEENQYFTVKYTFTDLDQPENLQALYDLGIVDGTDGISLAACEQSALEAGYVKR